MASVEMVGELFFYSYSHGADLDLEEMDSDEEMEELVSMEQQCKVH